MYSLRKPYLMKSRVLIFIALFFVTSLSAEIKVNSTRITSYDYACFDGEQNKVSPQNRQQPTKAVADCVTGKFNDPGREYFVHGGVWRIDVIGALAAISEEPHVSITGVTNGNTVGNFTNLWIDTPVGIAPAVANKIYADIDASFEENAFPLGFARGSAIRTKWSDRGSTGLSLITFTTNIITQICVWLADSTTIGAWVASENYTDSLYNISALEEPFSGYCDLKIAGTYTLGGNTTDGSIDNPMYFVSVTAGWLQKQDVFVPGPTDPGEYRFSGDWQVPESATTGSVDVLRENGSGGAVSVDVTDVTSTTALSTPNRKCVDATDYTSPVDTTRNWADNVSGNSGGHDITTLNVASDCDTVWEFTNATGGIVAGLSKQTQITTVQDSAPAVANFYIDVATGDDTDDGTTEALAWKTFGQLCANVSPGDIVLVKNGTYPATTGDDRIINMPQSCSGTVGNLITIKNFPGHSPQLGRLPATTDDQHGIVLVGADYIRFEGLNFVGTEHKCLNIASNGENGSIGIEVVGNTFDQCGRAHTSCTVDFGHDAIDAGPRTIDLLIDGNLITNSGRVIDPGTCDGLGSSSNHQYRHDHAVYLKGKGHIFRNNVVLTYPAGVGVKIDGYMQTLGQVIAPDFSHIIINNTFGPNTSVQPYDCLSGAPALLFNSTPSSFDPRWLIANNIFLEPVRDCSAEPTAVFIRDKSSQNFATANECRSNIASGPHADDMCGESIPNVAVNITYSNNVLAATLSNLDFVDEPNDDYDLNVSSTAIGAADCTLMGAPTTDFDGNARSSTTCDVGAYEN